ncbi:hypothetical protein [Bacillus sp. AFS055030]|uniref:hypothetical protein n=1 Tax=Bacillus sp. AFS055030 TaxID=2033507 RepID=UPI000BFCA678|nr:hypothetical protein [Bacillus sp. AFS055030]PGL69027.1 hypothetical protein CN925_16120 [Bacillus sp. AFS055030]
MKKAIFAGAVVSLFTLNTIAVNAETNAAANYYVHPHHDHDATTDHGEHHRHHHHHKAHKMLEKHKKEVVKYLSKYLNQPEAKLNKIVEQHKLKMKKLIFIAVVSKLSNKPLENIIAQKNKTNSFKEILDNNNIKREQFFEEMKKVHRDIFTQIEPTKN